MQFFNPKKIVQNINKAEYIVDQIITSYLSNYISEKHLFDTLLVFEMAKTFYNLKKYYQSKNLIFLSNLTKEDSK